MRGFCRRRLTTIFVGFEEVKGWRRRRRRRGRTTNFHGLEKKVEEDEEKWANVEVRRILKTNNIISWVLNLLHEWRRDFIRKKIGYMLRFFWEPQYIPFFFINFSTNFMLRIFKTAAYKVFSIIVLCRSSSTHVGEFSWWINRANIKRWSHRKICLILGQIA